MEIVPPVASSLLSRDISMQTSLPGVAEGLGTGECPAPLSCP
jgi:hypothetical protein